MNVENLIKAIDADFYTGVPDSQLKALCDFLVYTYGVGCKHHIISANEGNATALAAGYYLATGRVPVVYMQNSGVGNVINPVASLMNDKVYGIPCIYIIGWRGEPGIHDEPQHIFQGEVTIRLLEDMDIRTFVITRDTTEKVILRQLELWRPLLDKGKQVAFVVKKGALEYEKKIIYSNENTLLREDIIRHIVEVGKDDIVVATTGKASRELFEIRESRGQSHNNDFLTVGSMGHASSIALGVALNKPEKKVWIIDGDGALLMHMGSMAVIGANLPKNIVHIVINNGAHETVGGQPTVANRIDIVKVAEGCGYPNSVCVNNFMELTKALEDAKYRNELSLIEVKCAIGARDNLGRPTTTARDNKEKFMEYLAL